MVTIRAVLILSGLVLVLSACTTVETEAQLTELDSAVSREIPDASMTDRPVSHVSLPDVGNGGEPFSFVARDEGALVVYFGFTSCPDVCPTTLADLRTALEGVDSAENVDVAMVTVDPERDGEQTMQAYLAAFFPDGYPLRTDDQSELTAATDAFGVTYSINKLTDGSTQVFHTAYLYAIDDDGMIRQAWPFGTEFTVIREDLNTLLDGYAATGA
ncbi:MAG: redoxin domain-containing protein [Proteobacteria bacterium]|nr:redoxin domain-containing protein [Pseudomonadota bacterium]